MIWTLVMTPKYKKSRYNEIFYLTNDPEIYISLNRALPLFTNNITIFLNFRNYYGFMSFKIQNEHIKYMYIIHNLLCKPMIVCEYAGEILAA